MSDSLPFAQNATEEDLTPEQEEALIEKLIKKELIDVRDYLAFCMEKMILSGDTTTDDIKEKMDIVFPNLVDHAQMYYKILLQGPAYDAYEQEDKDEALECGWPKKLPAVLLMQYGANITNVGAKSFAQAIGDDKATGQFFKSLVYVKGILYQKLLDVCDYSEEELPMERIIDAVDYARGTTAMEYIGEKDVDVDITGDVPFKKWFGEALIAAPLEFYTDLMDTPRMN